MDCIFLPSFSPLTDHIGYPAASAWPEDCLFFFFLILQGIKKHRSPVLFHCLSQKELSGFFALELSAVC